MKDTNLFNIKKIKEIYDKLLDISFKLIMYQSNKDNYDECILPYLNDGHAIEKYSQNQLFTEKNKA